MPDLESVMQITARLETEIDALRKDRDEWKVSYERAISRLGRAVGLVTRLSNKLSDESGRGYNVRMFAIAILHGDDAHRVWLLRAAEDFAAGRQIPGPPRCLA